MLNKTKKIILNLFGDFVLNILIFTVILVLCKVFSPVFLIGPFPAAMIYLIIITAAKSGKVSGWGNKQIPINRKYMFSLTLTMWISLFSAGSLVIIASLLKWQYNGIFWASFFALHIAIYFLLVLFNPHLKKINAKSHS
jgi:hypothetical protein